MTAGTVPERKFAFTVATGTYNSVGFLQRVYGSLVRQTLRDFEWLVIDDASTDGTVALVRQYASELDVETVLVEKPVNRGYHDSYNIALERARGELFVAIGHDDEFDADALEFFLAAWNGIPAADRGRYCGIGVLCRSEDGKDLGRYPRDGMDSNTVEMYGRYKMRQEQWWCYRTAVMREYHFPSQYTLAAEGAFVWLPMGLRYQTRYFNRALRTYYRDNPLSLSRHLRGFRCPEGMADSNLRIMDFELLYPWRNLFGLLLSAARYLRFSRHAGERILTAWRRMPGVKRLVGAISLPIALAMLCKDGIELRAGKRRAAA